MTLTPGREMREPCEPDIEERVRTSFGRQRLMQTMGARLAAVRSGEGYAVRGTDQSLICAMQATMIASPAPAPQG